MKAVRLSLLLALLFLLPSLVRAQADPDPARFAKDIESFRDWDRKNTPPKDAILFVGSSSIRMWPTASSFPSLVVLNRGFGGSHISEVNHYFDDVVLKYRPRMIVFYAGDNDINDGKTPERVLADYRTFVERVRGAFRGIPIVYLPIKPSPSRAKVWPQANRANELIRAYSSEHPHLYYADLATPMLMADGKPDPSLFLQDMLHLNEKGYALWSRTLLPILQKAK